MFRFLLVNCIICFKICATSISAQSNNDCSNATVLCGSQPQLASNFGATVDVCPGCSDGALANGNFCYILNNSIWYSFTTNSVGGDVTVSFSNLQCIVANNVGNGIQTSIIAATTPCNESTYTLVAPCESGQITDFQSVANALAPNTTYYIQVDGVEGVVGPAECSFTIEVSGLGVDVIVDAGADQFIAEGEAAELNGIGPSGSVWSPTSGLSSPATASTTASPSITTTYTYSFVSTNGCVYADNVSVILEKPIVVMNTFTPNADGINDFWEIKDAVKFEAIKVTVFDRWGQKVFYTIGYTSDKRWDGTFLGRNLPPGVYYYVIDLNQSNKDEVFTGYVTIIR